MKNLTAGFNRRILCATLWLGLSTPCLSLPVFINEIHYDNAGSDLNEGIELAGLAGTDLGGWRLQLYNGGNGNVYRTVELSGVLDDQLLGYGVSSFAIRGIQNGAPDGVALIDNRDSLQQFISYEGQFVANNGLALGSMSHDIGISQAANGSPGQSLQMFGTGIDWMDFSWGLASASFGVVNNDQSFDVQIPPATQSVAGPSSLGLLALAVILLAVNAGHTSPIGRKRSMNRLFGIFP